MQRALSLGEYQLTAYYGKISITKSFVVNLSLYGLVGLGQVSFGDSSMSLAVGFWFGAKSFISLVVWLFVGI